MIYQLWHLLADSAARMMTHRRGYENPAERIWGTLPIHLARTGGTAATFEIPVGDPG